MTRAAWKKKGLPWVRGSFSETRHIREGASSLLGRGTAYTELPAQRWLWPRGNLFTLGFWGQYPAGIQLRFLCCSPSTHFPMWVLPQNPCGLGAFCSRDPTYSVQQGCKGGFTLTRSKATVMGWQLPKANQVLSQQKPQLTGQHPVTGRCGTYLQADIKKKTARRVGIHERVQGGWGNRCSSNHFLYPGEVKAPGWVWCPQRSGWDLTLCYLLIFPFCAYFWVTSVVLVAVGAIKALPG